MEWLGDMKNSGRENTNVGKDCSYIVLQLISFGMSCLEKISSEKGAERFNDL